MVTRCLLALGLSCTSVMATITVTSSDFDTSNSQLQSAIAKLDTSLGSVTHSLFSVVGPGLSTTMGQVGVSGARFDSNLPGWQVETSFGIITPGKQRGDEALTSLPFLSANLILGKRLGKNHFIQARGFYLPEISIKNSKADFTFRQGNFGLSYIHLMKKPEEEFWGFAVLGQFDAGYSGGELNAALAEKQVSASFDPDGTGPSAADAAKLDFKFKDDFNLNWDVISLSSGIYLSRPFKHFDFIIGYMATLHIGSATLDNTATGTIDTTFSPVSGTDVFETNDSANVVLKNTSIFRPNVVSHNLPFIMVFKLASFRASLAFSRNITANVNSFLLSAGVSF